MSSIIEEIKAGNKKAVIVFYKTFAPKIERYLNRRLPHDVAQEILNDVFLDALDEIPLLKYEGNILGWLYRIARNKTIDYYRKKKIKSVLLSQIPYLEIAASALHDPEFQMEKNKIRDKIEKTMLRLSEKYRRILHMHYEDGMKVKEIALAMNMSFKATESLLFRARAGFMKEYERT
jgi:RNA polymerase sigma-70 factor (ECF subfamily)